MEEKKKEIKRKVTKRIIVPVLASLVLSLLPGASKAQGSATLFFSPASGNFPLGARFSVGVFVQSRDEAMNAFETTVRFPTDKLEVTGLSKSGVITSLFVQEPSYSNSAGTVSLVGVVLNPGYTGSAGKLLTINFRAKGVGSARVTMTGSSVLANDGQGTNILSGTGGGTYNISSAPVKEEPPPVPTGVGPPAPKVTSKTHPDSAKWYSNNEPEFSWPLTSDIDGVSFLIDQKSSSNPGTRSDGLLSTHLEKGLSDGVWYFHIRLHNKTGWGDITHFKFQVDKTPPDFRMTEIPRADATEPRVQFTFEASDKTSGVDYFEVQIDDLIPYIWRDDGSHRFETQALGPGKHRISVSAFDKAANTSPKQTIEFTVVGLIPPKITEWPREITRGERLIVKGLTYPEATVTLFLQRENDEVITEREKSDADGKFTFGVDQRLKEGTYKIWAEVMDSRGARSGPSESVTTIVLPTPFKRFLIKFFSYFLPILNFLLLLLLLLLYILRRFMQWKKKLRKEVREAGTSLHKAFDLLRDDLRNQIKLLQKVSYRRELTQEEESILNKLKEDLDEAEAIIKREIQDVEDVLK